MNSQTSATNSVPLLLCDLLWMLLLRPNLLSFCFSTHTHAHTHKRFHRKWIFFCQAITSDTDLDYILSAAQQHPDSTHICVSTIKIRFASYTKINTKPRTKIRPTLWRIKPCCQWFGKVLFDNGLSYRTDEVLLPLSPTAKVFMQLKLMHYCILRQDQILTANTDSHEVNFTYILHSALRLLKAGFTC